MGRTIDYKSEDLKTRLKKLTNGKGADIYLDMVGGDAFDASLRAIAWDGRIVIIGLPVGPYRPPANILLVKNCSVIGFYWEVAAAADLFDDQMADLFHWFEQASSPRPSTITFRWPKPPQPSICSRPARQPAVGAHN